MKALKEYFEKAQRLVKIGDVIAVPVSITGGETGDEVLDIEYAHPPPPRAPLMPPSTAQASVNFVLQTLGRCVLQNHSYRLRLLLEPLAAP